MNRLLFTSLSSGLMAAMTIGFIAPAQANPDYASNYCTDTIQEETYTIQSSDHVRVTEVRPQVTRTCYERSPNQTIYFSNSYPSNSYRSHSYPFHVYHSRPHRDSYRTIVPPQIQIRLGGPNLSITNGWRRDNWERRDNWGRRDNWDNRDHRGYHRQQVKGHHRSLPPIGFPIFNRYRYR